jgi:immune inhibitor A
MRKAVAGLAGLSLATTFVVSATTASAAPKPAGATSRPDPVAAQDYLADPLSSKQAELRQQAIKQVIAGQATPQKNGPSTVVRVGSTVGVKSKSGSKAKTAKYVELKRETTDRVFVVLTEFGNQRDPNYPDQDTDPDTPGPAVFDGPLHNAIPQPNRALDNSTNWRADYNRAYFQNLYFGAGPNVESLKTYYEKQSSGRYSVSGTVTDWVKVPYNEARYGRSDGYPCTSNVCSNTWDLVRDAVNKWVADQLAQGRTQAQVTAELKTFDQWDRYDFDGDGNFNEPDGYIDHFQIVHAGGDQADGDPQQGEDAIWSHRWYAYVNQAGVSGPANNKLGGTQVGTTGLWVGDYTIQPENGGRSVFFHEYGHDLGLPDLYDTAGGVGEPMEWWSLMAQSRLGAKGDQSIGNRAGDLSAWDKLQLGWLDYDIAVAGQNRTVKLGPAEYNSKDAQALVVVLPKKTVTTDIGAPAEGSRQWWSGQGDDLTATMTRPVTLPAGSASLQFQARWNIEDCGADACDYAFVEVDDGSGWTAIPGSITNPAEANGIDGYQPDWTPAAFDLSAYAGKTINLRVRYATDPAAQGTDPEAPAGIFVDALTVTANGSTLLSDGAETSPNGWALAGFASVAATITAQFDNYYIAAYRTYVSYDRYLKYGPYNFGWATTKPDQVEHFAYQQGLVVSYWNTQYSDNNVSVHPGEGEILTIDSHPAPLYRLDGQPWRARIQLYDAAFGNHKADSFTLHVNGQASYIRGQAGNPVFNDTKNYFDPVQTDHGVKVAKAGVKITVVDQNGTNATIKLGRVATT